MSHTPKQSSDAGSATPPSLQKQSMKTAPGRRRVIPPPGLQTPHWGPDWADTPPISTLRVRALRINIIAEERLSFISDMDRVKRIKDRLDTEGPEPVYLSMLKDYPQVRSHDG